MALAAGDLELSGPALRDRRPSPDVVTALTVYLVLLFAIPSDLRIPSLGGAGSLAGLWALAGGLWWCWFHLQRSRLRVEVGSQPVRVAALVFLGCVLASYVAAMTRPIAALEVRQADIGILRILSCLGLLLLTLDGVAGLDRLRVLLRRLSWAGAFLALVGLAQFVTKRPLVDGISIPGMVATQDFAGTGDRGGFVRSAGTAMSPLEYGLALSTAFPVAVTFALYGTERRLLVRWGPTACIGAALLVSGSRSALLGLVVGVVVMFPAWSARIRGRMIALGVVAILGVAVAVPGMIGTLRYLFTETSNDSSAQSRAGSYDLVAEFVSRSPFVGRGFGTFLPEYRILDNQYLLLVIEVGVVGLLAFLGLAVTAAACALVARKRFATELDKQLGQALAAAMLAGAALTAFFDAFGFPIAVGCLFLTIGLCGAYWRLARIAQLGEATKPVDATA